MAGRRIAPYKRFAGGKTLAQGEFISPEHFDPKGPPRGLTRGEVMPGLPKVPAANKIDVSADGEISGLF